jgi:hypothetical protein
MRCDGNGLVDILDIILITFFTPTPYVPVWFFGIMWRIVTTKSDCRLWSRFTLARTTASARISTLLTNDWVVGERRLAQKTQWG